MPTPRSRHADPRCGQAARRHRRDSVVLRSGLSASRPVLVVMLSYVVLWSYVCHIGNVGVKQKLSSWLTTGVLFWVTFMACQLESDRKSQSGSSCASGASIWGSPRTDSARELGRTAWTREPSLDGRARIASQRPKSWPPTPRPSVSRCLISTASRQAAKAWTSSLQAYRRKTSRRSFALSRSLSGPPEPGPTFQLEAPFRCCLIDINRKMVYPPQIVLTECSCPALLPPRSTIAVTCSRSI
jgi:hypothetical protein